MRRSDCFVWIPFYKIRNKIAILPVVIPISANAKVTRRNRRKNHECLIRAIENMKVKLLQSVSAANRHPKISQMEPSIFTLTDLESKHRHPPLNGFDHNQFSSFLENLAMGVGASRSKARKGITKERKNETAKKSNRTSADPSLILGFFRDFVLSGFRDYS